MITTPTLQHSQDLRSCTKAEIGEREFSAYVTEAIARRYQLDQLARLLEEMGDESGAVPEAVSSEVASWWPDGSLRQVRGASGGSSR